MNVQEQILKAAQELFFQYGIKNVTMDDIARHLSMSKRTIYENFPTKDDIVGTLLTNHLEENMEVCKARGEESKNAIEEIVLMMQHIREVFTRMNPRLLFELKQGFLMKTISDNIHRGIAEGIYRKNLDVPVLARLRIEQVEFASNPEIFPSSEF